MGRRKGLSDALVQIQTITFGCGCSPDHNLPVYRGSVTEAHRKNIRLQHFIQFGSAEDGYHHREAEDQVQPLATVLKEIQMFNWLNKLITVNDSPGSRFNRKWRWRPVAGQVTSEHWGWTVYAALELQLTQLYGKPVSSPIPVKILQINLHPWKKWGANEEHIYYDGPHCFYNFGPFTVHKHWGWCDKCLRGD